MSTQTRMREQEVRQAPQAVEIELLALDLTRCDRCRGTLANIETAIETIRPVLEATGAEVRLRTVVIGSEAEARRHRLVTSPTIRINGRDIAPEVLESECEACSDLGGCDEGIACRVWRYRGREYSEAPVGLIVEALLRGIVGDASEPDAGVPAYDGVPENLRRFFAAGSAGSSGEASSCCGSARQGACCEPGVKASCCEPAGNVACCDAAAPQACGCT